MCLRLETLAFKIYIYFFITWWYAKSTEGCITVFMHYALFITYIFYKYAICSFFMYLCYNKDCKGACLFTKANNYNYVELFYSRWMKTNFCFSAVFYTPPFLSNYQLYPHLTIIHILNFLPWSLEKPLSKVVKLYTKHTKNHWEPSRATSNWPSVITHIEPHRTI